MLEHGAHVFGQADQPQQVGNGGAGFTHSLCHLGLGQAELFLQALEGKGFFDRVQVFALDVLDQRHGDGGFIRHIADDGGNAVELGHLGSAPAAFTGNQFIAAFGNRAHHHRLHHTLLANGICQFLQGGGVHIPARLVTATLDEVYGDLPQFAIVFGHLLVQVNLRAL